MKSGLLDSSEADNRDSIYVHNVDNVPWNQHLLNLKYVTAYNGLSCPSMKLDPSSWSITYCMERCEQSSSIYQIRKSELGEYAIQLAPTPINKRLMQITYGIGKIETVK